MIVLWLVLAVVGIFAFIFVKLEHHMRLFKFAAIGFVVLMIYFSMSTMFNSEAVDLSTPTGIVNAVYTYIGWLGETTTELWAITLDTTKVVGNVIKVDDNIKEDLNIDEKSIRDRIADLIRKD